RAAGRLAGRLPHGLLLSLRSPGLLTQRGGVDDDQLGVVGPVTGDPTPIAERVVVVAGDQQPPPAHENGNKNGPPTPSPPGRAGSEIPSGSGMASRSSTRRLSRKPSASTR